MLFRVEKRSLLDVLDKEPIEGWVLFTQSSYWWSRFLKKGFSHCSLLIRKEDIWVMMSPSLGFAQIHLLPVGVTLKNIIPNVSCMIRFKVWATRKRYRLPWVISPFTCVEQIKAFLGIRNPVILTPYQLFKHLGGHDGRVTGYK